MKTCTGEWSVQTAETVMLKNPGIPRNWGAYDEGVVLLGIADVYEKTGDEKFLNFIRAAMDRLVLPEGEIRGYHQEDYNIDHIHNGRVLLYLYTKTGDVKYRMASERLRLQLNSHPRTAQGGFWHKKIYEHQMWLDGLYMGSPFYAQFASLFGDKAAFDDVTKQFVLMYDHAHDPGTGLLYHGWDESRRQHWADPETGQSPNFWGRALGWYLMGLVDTLDYLPHPGKNRLLEILRRLIDPLLSVRDPATGLWYQVLDQGKREGNYLEASASAMFLYAMAKSIRLGYIHPLYLDAVRKGYGEFLSNLTKLDQDGNITVLGVCKVAGLGRYSSEMKYRDGSFEYYISEPVIQDDPKGVGAFIRASVEMEKLRYSR